MNDGRYLMELMNNLQSTYGGGRGDRYAVYCPVKGDDICTALYTVLLYQV